MKGRAMILRSTSLGEIRAHESSLRYFADGLMGFESQKRYSLVEVPDFQPFRWLIAVDDPSVAFAVAPPECFFPGRYEVHLGDADRDALELQPGDAVDVFVLVSSTDGGRKLTANLKGPLVVNDRNRMGRQVVIYNPAYSVRQSWLGPAERTAHSGAVILDRALARG